MSSVCRDNASNWSADRVMKEHPEFMNLSTSNDEPIYFTGEMVSRPFLFPPSCPRTKLGLPPQYSEIKLPFPHSYPIPLSLFLKQVKIRNKKNNRSTPPCSPPTPSSAPSPQQPPSYPKCPTGPPSTTKPNSPTTPSPSTPPHTWTTCTFPST